MSDLLLFNVIAYLVLTGARAQHFQWSCSPLDTVNNQYILPNIELDDNIIAINSDNFVTLDSIDDEFDTRSHHIYSVFPIPPSLNCSGNIAAMKYCYHYSDINFDNDQERIFTLLTLRMLEQTSNRVRFGVVSRIDVTSTPSDDLCTSWQATEHYCCDEYLLGAGESFELPAPNFAFGVVPSSYLLIYDSSIPANGPFIVEHFSEDDRRGILDVGDIISFTENEDEGLFLLQFHIVLADTTDSADVTSDMTVGGVTVPGANTTAMDTSRDNSAISTAVKALSVVLVVLTVLIIGLLVLIFVVKKKRTPSQDSAHVQQMGSIKLTPADSHRTNPSCSAPMHQNVAYEPYDECLPTTQNLAYGVRVTAHHNSHGDSMEYNLLYITRLVNPQTVTGQSVRSAEDRDDGDNDSEQGSHHYSIIK